MLWTVCIDCGCPGKQLICQFLYLKLLPTEDLKAWGASGKLVIPAPYLWLSRFLFVPPLAEDEIMISVCSYQFSKILHLFIGSWYLSISLTYMHMLTCMLTHTHTHLSFPNVAFYLIALCHDLKTFHFGAYTFIQGQGFSICCHQEIAQSFTASPKPSPRDRRKVLGAEPSELRKWVEHWEIKESNVDWGRGINQEILRSLWSLWLH